MQNFLNNSKFTEKWKKANVVPDSQFIAIYLKNLYIIIYITILFKFTKCDSYINQLVYHTITITIIYNYSITHDILSLLDEDFAR